LRNEYSGEGEGTREEKWEIEEKGELDILTFTTNSSMRRLIPLSYLSFEYTTGVSRLLAYLITKSGNRGRELARLYPRVTNPPTSTSKSHFLTSYMSFVESVQQVHMLNQECTRKE